MYKFKPIINEQKQEESPEDINKLFETYLQGSLPVEPNKFNVKSKPLTKERDTNIAENLAISTATDPLIQGLSLGWSDEAMEAWLKNVVGTPESAIDERTKLIKDVRRENKFGGLGAVGDVINAVGQASNVGLEVAGGAATSMIGGSVVPVVKGAGLLPSLGRIGTSAAQGAVEGAIATAGFSEGDKLKNATTGAIVGSVLGGGVQGLGEVARGYKRMGLKGKPLSEHGQMVDSNGRPIFGDDGSPIMIGETPEMATARVKETFDDLSSEDFRLPGDLLEEVKKGEMSLAEAQQFYADSTRSIRNQMSNVADVPVATNTDASLLAGAVLNIPAAAPILAAKKTVDAIPASVIARSQKYLPTLSANVGREGAKFITLPLDSQPEPLDLTNRPKATGLQSEKDYVRQTQPTLTPSQSIDLPPQKSFDDYFPQGNAIPSVKAVESNLEAFYRKLRENK
jgi:hypothetical protein